MAEHAVPTPPSGTVTFLFSDIEGSTKRWEHLPQAMSTALVRHDNLLRNAIEGEGGYVFKTVGDEFCAAFADPAAALRAASAAQHALASEEWGETGPIRVRMALHTGVPEQRGNDYFGPPVNRVARLLATGYGEQMLLSAVSASLVRAVLPADTSLIDLGAHRLKDLLQPEHIYQFVAPGLQATFPPIKSLDRQAHNLPAQPAPLIGREADVARARALIEGHTRLLTLTGPGGTGKTRLALQAAAELIDHFPDGAWFVGLAPLTDPALVVAAIARPLGVRESGYESLEQSLIEYLRDKQLLLVLDNFEHLLPAVPVVGRILESCPGVSILATSRAALRVYGERELAVPPLALPDLKALPPAEELAAVEAVALFVDRAQAVKPDFEVTAANARAVAEICVRLEGLPLAIELAATRVRILPPDALLARLARRLDLLTGGASDRDARQRTLRGAIAWSHDLLSPAEQTLFRRLAVFAGGTFEAIEAVTRDGDVDVLDGLESLVTKSLLRQEEGTGEPRFFMLETIREFATEQLQASGEATQVCEAHAAHFLRLAEQAEPELTGAEQARWLARLETEHDNLRAALDWFDETGQVEAELRLAAALWRFWSERGWLTEGRQRLDHAVEVGRAGAGAPPIYLRLLEGAGVLAEMQGDLHRAAELYEAERRLAVDTGDRPATARALYYLGIVAETRSDYRQASALYEEALALQRELGNERGIAVVMDGLYHLARLQDDLGRAETLATETLALHRKLHYPRGEATALQNLGMLAQSRLDYLSAAALYEESLAVWRDLGERHGTAYALVNLGRVLRVLGDRQQPTVLFEEALPLFREMGDKAGTAYALFSLGLVAHGEGEERRAEDLLVESLQLRQQVGEKRGVAQCLEALAGVICVRGDYQEGVLLFGAAEALWEEMGVTPPAVDRENYERDVANARAALDATSFKAAWAMGRLLSPDDAVAEAIGVPA